MNKKNLALILFSLLLASAVHADMTLAQAIERALQSNVSLRLANAKTAEARGQAIKDAAGLLPKVLGTVSQSRVFKQNLEAAGFEPGQGFNTLLGPYNSFDARISLTQNLLDVNQILKAQAGKRAAEATALEEDLAKEQVASAAALSYLELVRSHRAVEAAKTDSDLASSLFALTKDQRHAGLSTGVDVARAQTRMEEGKLRLIRAENAERQASLRLARLLDMPLDQPILPADTLAYSSSTILPIEQALGNAQRDRYEMGIAELMVRSEKDLYESARAANAPSLQGTADYGLSGTSPMNQEKTGSINARLNIPIFSGREMEGETKASQARFHQAEIQRDDVRKQIEEDVRLSLGNLLTEEQEVATADERHGLAEREMQMARDRYAAGVGDNIQIITAQNTLAQADDDLIGALARYDEARLSVEMALGHARSFTLNSSRRKT